MDRAASLELLVCRSCGQLWRLALPPTHVPHAWKVDTRGAWAEEPVPAKGGVREPDLPIWPTVKSAFSKTWFERRPLSKLLVLPWALCAVANTCVRFEVDRRPAMDPALAEWIPIAIGSLISIATAALFGLAWHRRILLGEPVASWWRCHSWTAAHAPFFAWSLALSFLTFAPALPFWIHRTNPEVLLGTPVLLAVAYVVSRLSIALPATAVGAANDIRSVWSLSQGRGVPLVVIVLMAGIAASVVLLPITIALGAAMMVLPSWKYALLPIREAQGFLVTAIEISALSLSYKRLTEIRGRSR